MLKIAFLIKLLKKVEDSPVTISLPQKICHKICGKLFVREKLSQKFFSYEKCTTNSGVTWNEPKRYGTLTWCEQKSLRYV